MSLDIHGFNATTAFLLPGGPGRAPPGQFGFNATTAFLLLTHGVSPIVSFFWFQCHHGVPASPS